MITAIALTAVTVDIVAQVGRDWQWQCLVYASDPARAAQVSNQAMVAAQAKEARQEFDGNNCKQPEEEIIRKIQMVKLMTIMI